jgi:hypothetical protein
MEQGYHQAERYRTEDAAECGSMKEKKVLGT